MTSKIPRPAPKDRVYTTFTTDGWAADHKTESFYGITTHFIDERWILRSITLHFRPPRAKHSGKDLANIFFQALKDYEIEGKIQGITVDNVSSNKTFIAYLSTLLNLEGIKFSFTDQHFKCMAHVINLGLQDVLKLLKVVHDDKNNVMFLDNDDINLCDESSDNNSYIDSENELENESFADLDDLVDADSGEGKWVTIIFNIRETFKK